MKKNTQKEWEEQQAAKAKKALNTFLEPVLKRMTRKLDSRLVRTMGLVVEAMLRMGDQAWKSLVATELMGGSQEPAGVKRIDRLLKNSRWKAEDLQEELRRQADERVSQETKVLIAVDPSDFEHPESLKAEELERVVSTDAKRLSRPRKGFGGMPLTRPVIVPGYHCIYAVVMGMRQTAWIAGYRFWKKAEEEAQRTLQTVGLIQELVERWGPKKTVIIGDRGLGIRPILGWLLDHSVAFTMRFTDHYLLQVAKTEEAQATKEILKGKRAFTSFKLWDPQLRQEVDIRLLWTPVFLPERQEPMWLVIARHPHRANAWRLITNQPVFTREQAWEVTCQYIRRWQVEWTIRFSKCGLGIDTVRLLLWQRRDKWIALLFLAHAFVIWMRCCCPEWTEIVEAGCHRTGRRSRLAISPLYRIRQSLQTLWRLYFPTPARLI